MNAAILMTRCTAVVRLVGGPYGSGERLPDLPSIKPATSAVGHQVANVPPEITLPGSWRLLADIGYPPLARSLLRPGKGYLTGHASGWKIWIYREVTLADSPYQKAPGTYTALVVAVVLLLLMLVAFMTVNAEFSNWM